MRHLSCLLRLLLPPEMDEMTNFHVRNRMISAIEMSDDRLVNIVASYGTKMFGKPVRDVGQSHQCRVYGICCRICLITSCLFLFLAFHWLTFYHMTPIRVKPGGVAISISEHGSFSDEGPLLETLGFFEVSHGGYQPLGYYFCLTFFSLFF